MPPRAWEPLNKSKSSTIRLSLLLSLRGFSKFVRAPRRLVQRFPWQRHQDSKQGNGKSFHEGACALTGVMLKFSRVSLRSLMSLLARFFPYALVASLVPSLISPPAKAQPEPQDKTGFYVDAGFGLPTTIQVAGGYDFGQFRVDLGFYRNSGSEKTSVGPFSFKSNLSMNHFLVTGYYDFDLGRWSPYVGLGAGYASGKFDIEYPKESGYSEPGEDLSGFSFRGIGGVSYALNKSLDVHSHVFFIKQAEGNALFLKTVSTGGFGGGLGVRYRF